MLSRRAIKPRRQNAPRPDDPHYVCETCGKVVYWADKKDVYSCRRHFLKRRFCSQSCHKQSTRISLAEAYERHVIRRGATECWGWTGPTASGGYGRFTHNAKQWRANRASVEIHTGVPVPDDMFVCHHCDNPPCTNPAHLFVGTHLDNVRDAISKGRAPRAQVTAEQVLAIRADPRPHGEITRDYPIGKSGVEAIKNRRTWRHL